MTEIATIRKHLAAAARREPEQAPALTLLNKQLRNFDRETPEGKAALRPEIEKSVKRIEAAR